MVQARSEDLITSSFWVEAEGTLVAAFRECSGLSSEVEVMTYLEGGRNDYEHKLPGRAKHTNLTLRWGMANGADLWQWFQDVAMGQIQRKNVSIIMYGHSGVEAVRWNLLEAYPMKWQGPDLKADENTVAIQSLELAHHGITMSRS